MFTAKRYVNEIFFTASLPTRKIYENAGHRLVDL